MLVSDGYLGVCFNKELPGKIECVAAHGTAFVGFVQKEVEFCKRKQVPISLSVCV